MKHEFMDFLSSNATAGNVAELRGEILELLDRYESLVRTHTRLEGLPKNCLSSNNHNTGIFQLSDNRFVEAMMYNHGHRGPLVFKLRLGESLELSRMQSLRLLDYKEYEVKPNDDLRMLPNDQVWLHLAHNVESYLVEAVM